MLAVIKQVKKVKFFKNRSANADTTSTQISVLRRRRHKTTPLVDKGGLGLLGRLGMGVVDRSESHYSGFCLPASKAFVATDNISRGGIVDQ
jgi:hypothetical protein